MTRKGRFFLLVFSLILSCCFSSQAVVTNFTHRSDTSTYFIPENDETDRAIVHEQYMAARAEVMEEALTEITTRPLSDAVLACTDIRAYRAQLRAEAMREAMEDAMKTPPSVVRFAAAASTEDRATFYIDYILPVYYSQDQSTLLFFNPKQTWHSPRSDETNLGIGLRQLFEDKYIIGLNFFYDRRYSPNKFVHRQIGVGAEYLSEPFDLRFNYYHPVTRTKIIEDGYNFSETGLVYRRSVEEPLGGYDLEAGVPVFGNKLHTRFFSGGFFYNSRYGKDVNGFRARTETNLAKWLSLDTIYNQKAGGESEFIGGLRINLPLELTRKHPLLVPPRESPMKERMFERVVRDIDIQTQDSTLVESAKNSAGGDINMIYVNNANTSGVEDGTLSHPYNTLAEAFSSSRYGTGAYVYVFQGDGTAAGYTGTFTLADSVVLWGSGYDGGYKGIPAPGYPILDGGADGPVITLAENNTVMGLQLQNAGTSWTKPQIYSAVPSPTGPQTISHNIFLVKNTGEKTIIFDGVNTGTTTMNIHDNTFQAGSVPTWYYWLYLEAEGSGTFTLSLHNNTFTGNANTGGDIYMYVEDLSVFESRIYNNFFSGSGFNEIDTYNVSETRNYIHDNIFDAGTGSGGNAFYIYPYGSSSGTILNDIYNNTVILNGTGQDGFDINACDGFDQILYFHDNTITVGSLNNSSTALGLFTWDADTSTTASIYNNTIILNGTNQEGLDIEVWSDAVETMDIHDNTIVVNGTTPYAFYLWPGWQDNDLNSDTASIYNNTITANRSGSTAGMYLRLENGTVNYTFDNNTITGFDTAYGGVYIQLQRQVAPNLIFRNNTIFNNINGIYVTGASTSPVAIDLGGGALGSIGNNSIYNYSGYAIDNQSAGLTVNAENNWWGQETPDPAKFNGTVDYDPWQSTAPD